MKKGIDYIGIGIGAVILNNDGKFLLEKRGPKSKNEIGLWGFPGGAMEFGESIEVAIIREVKEELGVTIKPLKRLPPIDHFIPTEKQHWVAIPYISKLTRGTPKILEHEKCSDFGWFSLKEISRLKLSVVAKEAMVEIKERYSEIEDMF